MGCVASRPSATKDGVAIGDNGKGSPLAKLPVERHEFTDARDDPTVAQNPADAQPTTKVSDENQSKAQAKLMSLAMEAKGGDAQEEAMLNPVHSRATLDYQQDGEHHEDIPDLAYSIRANGDSRPNDSRSMEPLFASANQPGVSKNVLVNRPSIQHLQPGGINADFFEHHTGQVSVPMQSFAGVNSGVVPFMSMQPGPHPVSLGPQVHPSSVLGAHPHVYHLAPLDSYIPAQAPAGNQPPIMGLLGSRGRGGGRGFPHVGMGVPTPLLPGGFRGPVVPIPMAGGRGQIPIVMGRGRGQPLQILIPSGRSSHRGDPLTASANVSERSQRSARPVSSQSTRDKRPTGSHGDSEDDDDNDDLIEEGEEVEDWGIDVDMTHDQAVLSVVVAPSTAQLGPTKPPPVTPNVTATSKQAGINPPHKLRPVLDLHGDDVDNVESDSNDSDSDEEEIGDGGDDELHDWLDTSPNPKELTQKPNELIHVGSTTTQWTARPNAKVDTVNENSLASSARTPHTSPTRAGAVVASPVPTTRIGYQIPSAHSPHPPLPSQQASLRQLNSLMAHGSVSPTRPAGPPPAGSSPTKPPSYRTNINTSAGPITIPMSASGTPSFVTATGSPVAGAVENEKSSPSAAIRDTKVVKKKRAELPQANLPHPVPKFGDWLNSRTMINNYIILESLGAGSYAEVKLCKEKVTGKLYAMKFINRDIMKKDKLGKQSKLDDIKREIAIMKKLNHPNVLRLYEVMDDPSMNKLFLVLEYMKYGDLLSHQKKKQPNGASRNLHDRDLHCVLLQVILGLAYLHEQKIVHGDIKPQNLLVGDKDIVKIADFGISQSLYGSKQKLSDTAGTPAFMSPEMCSGQEYSGQLADIWAVGATIFMLKFGSPPFIANSAMQMFERIQNDPLVFPGPVDPLLEDLLRGMLTKNPAKRMTLLHIMTHPWVTKEENPSHFVLQESSPQITVTSEEIENAIDATDKFAIIVNIRVQMMKKLHKARQEILKRRQLAGQNDTSAHSHTMIASNIIDDEADVNPTPSSHHGGTVATKSTGKSSGRKRSNRIFVEHGSGSHATKASDGGQDQRMLSNEEIQYRSQLFSRKKVSGVASNGASSAAFPRALELEGQPPRDLARASTAERDESDDDVISDDDDGEHAVSQSPQLLDELLLTTLSMPPLTKSTPLPSDLADQTHPGVSANTSLAPQLTPPTQPHSSHEPLDPQSFYSKNRHLGISIAVSSLQGRRNTQEDRWTVLPDIDSGVSSRWHRSAFVGLYDGHGGEECANILQEQLHPWLFRSPDDHFSSIERLEQCFLEFDSFLCDYLLHKGDLSGSTATCLLVDHAASAASEGRWRLLVGHVGDCRLVLSRRNGETLDLTSDHRLTLAAERDRVLRLGGRVVNNRVNGVMAITRAFGDLEFKGLIGKRSGSLLSLIPDAVQQSPFQRDDERTPALLTARPDVHFVTVDAAQDEFLLLACDGLWDVMASEEAAAILRERLHLHGNLQLAAKELAQEGIRRYSNDNISVLVVLFPRIS